MWLWFVIATSYLNSITSLVSLLSWRFTWLNVDLRSEYRCQFGNVREELISRVGVVFPEIGPVRVVSILPTEKIKIEWKDKQRRKWSRSAPERRVQQACGDWRNSQSRDWAPAPPPGYPPGLKATAAFLRPWRWSSVESKASKYSLLNT